MYCITRHNTTIVKQQYFAYCGTRLSSETIQHYVVVGHKAWPTWCGTGWLLGVEGREAAWQRSGCGLEGGEGSGGEGEGAKWSEGEVGRRGGGGEREGGEEKCE